MMDTVAESYAFGEFDGDFTAFGFGAALVVEGELDIFGDGELLDEVVGLEDEAQACAANLGEVVVVHLGDVVGAEEVLALGGAVEASE